MSDSNSRNGDSLTNRQCSDEEKRELYERIKRELTPERLQELEEEFDRVARGDEQAFSLEEVIREMEEIHRQSVSEKSQQDAV